MVMDRGESIPKEVFYKSKMHLLNRISNNCVQTCLASMTGHYPLLCTIRVMGLCFRAPCNRQWEMSQMPVSVTNGKKDVGIHLNGGRALSTEVERNWGRFNAPKEISRTARMREESIEIFRKSANHSGAYRCDKFLTSRGFYTRNNHDKDYVFAEDCFVSP